MKASAIWCRLGLVAGKDSEEGKEDSVGYVEELIEFCCDCEWEAAEIWDRTLLKQHNNFFFLIKHDFSHQIRELSFFLDLVKIGTHGLDHSSWSGPQN